MFLLITSFFTYILFKIYHFLFINLLISFTIFDYFLYYRHYQGTQHF